MRIHRFYIGDFDFKQTNELEDRGIIHQIATVLSYKTGDKVIFFNSNGEEALIELTEIKKKKIVFMVVDRLERKPVRQRRVALLASIIKKDNFEWIVQKAGELGVYEIFPFVTNRSIKLGINKKRLEKIAVEAAEQSGQTRILKIHEPISFEDAAKLTYKKKIFLDFSEQIFSAEDLSETDDVLLFVGPEGGWSEDEKSLAEKHNYLIRSLGPNVLRAETAAVVSSFIALNY